LSGSSADLWITGEMSHHEVLDAVHAGTSVILCEHSNTERGFLKVFASKLTTLLDDQVCVQVSVKDADPLTVV
jgi:putative NIF3 family GTP cyclohydrolase 1 type 2